MQKLFTLMVAVVVGLAVAAIAHAGGDFRAKLSGAEEVPPVVDPDEPTSGSARFIFDEDDTAAEIRLEVRDGVRVTQAHIHCAPKGMNGPIVVFLAGFHELGWDVDGIWIRKATVTDANVIPRDPATTPTCPTAINTLSDVAQAMRDGNTYVNVHSVEHGSGVARGQIFQAK
jgi:hypothetical protein